MSKNDIEGDGETDIDAAYVSQLNLENEFKFKQEEADKRLDDFQVKCINELKKEFLKRRNHRQYLFVATGGGKTLIAIDFIHENLLQKSKSVLWVTHQPYLLLQAAKTLMQRHGRQYKLIKDIAYFGSQSDVQRHPYRKIMRSFRDEVWSEGSKPKFLLATWQALGNPENLKATRKAGKKLREFNPDLIIVDEAHWGKGGNLEKKFYDNLLNKSWENVPILGLSATPKVRRAKYSRWNTAHLGNVYFASLVGTRLAKPIEIPIKLKEKVKIVLDKYNRVDMNSNKNWIVDISRCEKIVQAYKREKYRLGKTLVVALNIDHANMLRDAFEHANESVVVIHSRESDPVDNLRRFIRGEYLIAIVVGMAKEGVDIPDLKTVMLAKPITSEIEFAQFVGRASRREFIDMKGNRQEKEVFYIVDFYDSLTNPENQKYLYHFKDYFRGVNDKENLPDEATESIKIKTAPTFSEKKIKPHTLKNHEFEARPVYKTLRYVDHCDVDFLTLNNLRINTRQTFGIEFELTAQKSGGPNAKSKRIWLETANALRSCLMGVFPQKGCVAIPVWDKDKVKDINYEKWNIVNDLSCGWEIVTPILKGENGFQTIAKFLAGLNSSGVLDKLKLEVNVNTGTHINLGWNFREPKVVKSLLKFMRAYEPALFTLVPQSRVVGKNEYSVPIGVRFNDSQITKLNTKSAISKLFSDYDERYHTVNLTKYDDPVQVLEIRLHSGTVSAHKILLWLSLWMNLLPVIGRADFSDMKTGESRRIKLPEANEHSDILYLLSEVVGLNAVEESAYLSLFDKRRSDVFMRNDWWKKKHKRHKSVVQYFNNASKKYLNR